MECASVIDLFSGAGGLTEGFRQAGFRIAAALEKEPRFAATHSHNFPHSHTICASITELPPKEFARLIRWRQNTSGILIGGPPCQTFSNIGAPKIKSLDAKRTHADPRNFLVHNYMEYVAHFKPLAFVIENVPGLKTKFNGSLLSWITKKAAELGYSTTHNILDAADYGVPQHRRRFFIIGTKPSKIPFTFPHPTHGAVNGQPPNTRFSVLRPYVTVGEAISDLPKIHDGIRAGKLKYKRNGRLSDFQQTIRSADGYVGNNICRMSNDRAKQVFRHMSPGMRYMDLAPEIRRILPFREDIFHDRLKRLRLDAPSWTVLAHIGMDGYMYIHPTDDRTLSVREAARIQSFPDTFEFVGNMREQYVQVGNSVPPLLATNLAQHLRKYLRLH